MKTVFRLGSVIVAVAVVFGISQLWAESKKKSAPRTRIGLFNLTFVIKNYGKYKQFQEEIRKAAAPFQERESELRSELKDLQAKAAQKEPEQRKELERQFQDLQRKLQENTGKAQQKLGKRNEEVMKIIYKEVEEAAERYATAHDLDLVLHYNDAAAKEDNENAQSVARKLGIPALLPSYMVPGMDISTEIVTDLNQRNPAGK